jgi:hypothetical protein
MCAREATNHMALVGEFPYLIPRHAPKSARNRTSCLAWVQPSLNKLPLIFNADCIHKFGYNKKDSFYSKRIQDLLRNPIVGLKSIIKREKNLPSQQYFG